MSIFSMRYAIVVQVRRRYRVELKRLFYRSRCITLGEMIAVEVNWKILCRNLFGNESFRTTPEDNRHSALRLSYRPIA